MEYQVEIPDQGTMVLYGDRHDRIAEERPVWLRLRPDGHSAWSRDTARAEVVEPGLPPGAEQPS